jgi:hypothetical protein
VLLETVALAGDTITDNTAGTANGGGGIAVANGGVLAIVDSIFASNQNGDIVDL